jgi:hypothetical protein
MMRKTALLFALSVASLLGRELFNGKNLEGWSFVGPAGQEGFVVKGGMITTAGAPAKTTTATTTGTAPVCSTR